MLPRARRVVLAVCVGAGGLALVRSGPPGARAIDAPAGEFSALRARERLAGLLADEAPHPVGSAAAAAVRGRLIDQLRGLGLTPEQQAGFSCSPAGGCAPVVNVFVRLPGREPGPALLLASHYDSVAAGPGAADDGHGVAVVLETLRALVAEGPARHACVAVFTDGEEAGLLGARLFVEHPVFAEVGAVLNLEARGTGGAARMFETSDGNAALIAAYAAGAPRPSAHSLSYEIYRRLPNDTDLTIFKRAGAQGLGFAFIGDVRRYHTPRDDLAHLDLGSVQQQGDALLGASRALLEVGIAAPGGNATYADVFGVGLLRWPAWLDLPLAGLALVLLGIASWRARSSGGAVRARAIAAAAGSVVLAPVVGAGAAWAAIWLVERASRPIGLWPAAVDVSLAAAASVASVAAALALRAVARRVGGPAQALGVWLVWAALAVVVAVVLPGASILWICPALAAGVGLLMRPAIGCAVAGGLAFALWAPLVPALVDALGLAPAVVGGLVGLLWSAASPGLADAPGERATSRGVAGLGLVAGVLAALAGVAPRVDADLPGKLNLLHVHDLDAGAAVHVLDAPDGFPEEYAHMAPGTGADKPLGPWQVGRPVPWSSRDLYVMPAPVGAAEGPTLTVTRSEARGELRRIHATLRARPGALALFLVLPEGALASLEVGGEQLDPATLRQGPANTRVVTIQGPPAAGVELIAELRAQAPWSLADGVAGPAASAAALVEMRPAYRVPYQMGDLQISLRSVTP